MFLLVHGTFSYENVSFRLITFPSDFPSEKKKKEEYIRVLWLVHWTTEREVWVRPLAGILSLTVPVSRHSEEKIAGRFQFLVLSERELYPNENDVHI